MMSYSSVVLSPSPMRGWLKKQSRGKNMLMTNWRRRYFILESGKLSYYENYDENSGKESNFKGSLVLIGAEVLDEEKKGIETQKRIYILSGHSTEHDILVQAADAAIAEKWKAAIRLHIRYATENPNLLDGIESSR
jgi:hypothetical protein